MTIPKKKAPVKRATKPKAPAKKKAVKKKTVEDDYPDGKYIPNEDQEYPEETGPPPAKVMTPPKGCEEINDYTTLFNTVRQGYGLTYACELSNNDVEVVSYLMQDVEALYNELQGAYKAGIAQTLEIPQVASTTGKYAAPDSMQKVPPVSALVLWEDYSSVETINEDIVIKLYMLFRGDVKEMATACGMHPALLADYINDNPDIVGVLSTLGYDFTPPEVKQAKN